MTTIPDSQSLLLTLISLPHRNREAGFHFEVPIARLRDHATETTAIRGCVGRPAGVELKLDAYVWDIDGPGRVS